MHAGRARTPRLSGIAAAAAFVCALAAGSVAPAEVILDGSLGPEGPVAAGRLPNGTSTDYLISGDLGVRAGDSLFHSFSRFGVESGRSATFTSGSHGGLARVIARVTGAEASHIDGVLRSTIGGASLFLLNPSGVVFGAGATLDIPGSFHVSTADTLRFADGTQLDLASSSAPVLSVASPEAFGFVRTTPSPIRFEGTGRVSTPFSFVQRPWAFDFVGGDVTFDEASLMVAGQRLSILSVGGPGLARVDDPVASASDFATLGNVQLLRGARVALLGPGAHEIEIAGDRLALEGEARLWGETTPIFRAPDISIDVGELSVGAGAWISASTFGTQPGGAISIRATRFVDVAGDVATRLRGSILSEAESSATGGGGLIDITTDALRIHDGGLVSASTQRRGEAGAVRFDVGTLAVWGGGSVDVSDRSNDDHHGPGRLDVTASESVSIGPGVWIGGDSNDLDTGLIASADVSDGGHIRVSAPRIEIDGRIGNDSDGVRQQTSAPVTLEAERIEIRDLGIETSSWNTAPAGDISIDVHDELRLIGGRIASDGLASGHGGTIRITGGSVVVADDAHHSRILARSAKARDDVAGGSDAGDIALDVDALVMNGGEIKVDTGGTGGSGGGGRAGSIFIRARDRVELRRSLDGQRDAARISAGSLGDAAGGSIRIEAPRIALDDGATLDATTTGVALAGAGPERQAGAAGSIVVHADDLSLASGAQIRTGTTGGAALTGEGGAVDIDAQRIVLGSSARIESSSDSAGKGGNVQIRAGRLELTGGASIATDATSTGAPGKIDVAASDSVTLSGVASNGTPTTISSRNAGPQTGGAVLLAGNTVTLRDGAEVTASSSGAGDAGSITVRAADALLLDAGRITTSAVAADGGDVQILVGRLVRLQGSEIAANVTGGQGGTISIDPVFVVLDSSRVTAQAAAGRGGSIRIVGDTILISQDSVVSASAGAAGIDGTVRIEGADGDLATDVQAIPAAYLAASELLRTRCAAAQGARGSLVAATGAQASPGESGWLPPPGDDLPGPAAHAHDGPADPNAAALVVATTQSGVTRARLLRCSAVGS